jgi:hypothetical protein
MLSYDVSRVQITATLLLPERLFLRVRVNLDDL